MQGGTQLICTLRMGCPTSCGTVNSIINCTAGHLELFGHTSTCRSSRHYKIAILNASNLPLIVLSHIVSIYKLSNSLGILGSSLFLCKTNLY